MGKETNHEEIHQNSNLPFKGHTKKLEYVIAQEEKKSFYKGDIQTGFLWGLLITVCWLWDD